jgi:hypothetical protein
MNAHKAYDISDQGLGGKRLLVGTARCAVRAAFSGATHQPGPCHVRESFRPLLRGRGHRSAMSLPRQNSRPAGRPYHFSKQP